MNNSNILGSRNILTVILFLSTTVLANANANAYQTGSILPSGAPNFTFGIEPNGPPAPNGQYPVEVNIHQFKSKGVITGYQLTAYSEGKFTLNTAQFAQSYEGKAGIFDLQANFDVNRSFLDGYVDIFGSVDYFGVKDETLTTADLVSWDWDSGLIGFNTDNIWCNATLALDCTTSESVYLVLKGSKTFNGLDSKGGFNAISVTTVPIPAALYLFGTGLIGLAGIARRKRGA